jgi:hypothetical protein
VRPAVGRRAEQQRGSWVVRLDAALTWVSRLALYIRLARVSDRVAYYVAPALLSSLWGFTASKGDVTFTS